MPVLKVKKNGVWEELGGTSPMDGGNADTLDGRHAEDFALASDVENVVYVNEENQESAVVPLNADTVEGYTIDGLQSLLINSIYPIGSIYVSVTSTNPTSLFGGTWEQIKDRFLLAAGSTYAAGSTGGEATHTLTIEEMPKHAHSGVRRASAGGTGGASMGVSNGDASTTYDTNISGGGKAHNNMPPYLAVYVWKRIS